jgi:hypothetical protein
LIQRVALPVRTLKVSESSRLVLEVAEIRAQIGQLNATRPTALNSLERIRQGVAHRTGVPVERSLTAEQSALLAQVERLIEDEYL